MPRALSTDVKRFAWANSELGRGRPQRVWPLAGAQHQMKQTNKCAAKAQNYTEWAGSRILENNAEPREHA
jgi:hypothetical protein